MKLSDLLAHAVKDAEMVGLDTLDALGHPLVVYGTNGDRLGQVESIAYETNELRLNLNAS